MGKYTVRKTATGYKFDLKAANGEAIATSEVYTSRPACLKGINSVTKCAASAAFADLTTDQTAGNPRFELFRDKSGEYRFRLRARNGKVILASQGYTTRTACENGIESVRKNSVQAEIEI